METKWFANEESVLVHLQCLHVLKDVVQNAPFSFEGHKNSLINLLSDLEQILVKISDEEKQK